MQEIKRTIVEKIPLNDYFKSTTDVLTTALYLTTLMRANREPDAEKDKLAIDIIIKLLKNTKGWKFCPHQVKFSNGKQDILLFEADDSSVYEVVSHVTLLAVSQSDEMRNLIIERYKEKFNL